MPTKRKMIVETSCVRVALNETNDKHRKHFESQVSDSTLYTSVYIRMEVIRAWVKGFIEVAFRIEHYGSVDAALAEIEEDFAIRKVKLGIHVVRAILRESGSLGNQKAAAKEVVRLAVAKLKLFDRRFPGRINNACGCRIGAKDLVVDHNNVFVSLRQFMEATSNITDCAINEYLGFDSSRGRATMLLEHSGAAITKAGAHLAKYTQKNALIDCRRCSRIGDVVIAMEQPKSFELAHIDGAFNELCAATGRAHVAIKSARACANEASSEGASEHE